MAERPKMRCYRWFPADWLGSETRLAMDLDEQGAFRNLLDWNYQEGSIPSDPAVLARFLGISHEEFERIWKRVSVKFAPAPDEEPGRLTNPRAAEVIAEEAEYRRKAAESGRRGAKTRWGGDRVPHRVPHQNPNGVSIASSPLPSSKKNTARSQANGAARESASPKRPARNAYEDWFEEFWREYPGARAGDAGGKKAAYAQACKFLTTAEQQAQAVAVLRAELKRREAKEAAGEFVPRLPYVERWFSKDYHGPAAERLAQPSRVEAKLPPMKMAWEA